MPDAHALVDRARTALDVAKSLVSSCGPMAWSPAAMVVIMLAKKAGIPKHIMVRNLEAAWDDFDVLFPGGPPL